MSQYDSKLSEQLQDFWLPLVPLVKNYPIISPKLPVLLHFISLEKYPDNLLWFVLSDTNISLT